MEEIKKDAREKTENAVEKLTEGLTALFIFMIMLVAITTHDKASVQILIVISAIIIVVTYFIAKVFFGTIYSKEAEKEIYNKILRGVLSPYSLTEIAIKDDINHQYKDFLLEIRKLAKFYAKLSEDKEHAIILINFPVYEEAVIFERIRFDEFPKSYILTDEL